jgi:hypothetical protein
MTNRCPTYSSFPHCSEIAAFSFRLSKFFLASVSFATFLREIVPVSHGRVFFFPILCLSQGADECRTPMRGHRLWFFDISARDEERCGGSRRNLSQFIFVASEFGRVSQLKTLFETPFF